MFAHASSNHLTTVSAAFLIMVVVTGCDSKSPTAQTPPSPGLPSARTETTEEMTEFKPVIPEDPARPGAVTPPREMASGDGVSAPRDASDPDDVPPPPQNVAAELRGVLQKYPSLKDEEERIELVGTLAALADAQKEKAEIARTLGVLLAQEQSPEVKVNILNVIMEVGDPTPLFQVSPGLAATQPPEVRMATMQAIGAMRDARGIPLLQPLLADSDPDVKESAAEAMQELKDSLAQ